MDDECSDEVLERPDDQSDQRRSGADKNLDHRFDLVISATHTDRPRPETNFWYPRRVYCWRVDINVGHSKTR
jgi:hypothetical protein